MGANAVLFWRRSDAKWTYARSRDPAFCNSPRYDNQDWEIYTSGSIVYNECCIRLYSVNGVRTNRHNDQDKCVTMAIWDKCGAFCGQRRCGSGVTKGHIRDGYKRRIANKYW